MTDNLRDRLVAIALEWEEMYGVAPHITSAISEYDAATIMSCPEDEYCRQMKTRTAVSKGSDFLHGGSRYQVKANRPSGRPGSRVTLVAKAKNYEWDYLVWILYDRKFDVQEAWLWERDQYRAQFHERKRLGPEQMREGRRLR